MIPFSRNTLLLPTRLWLLVASVDFVWPPYLQLFMLPCLVTDRLLEWWQLREPELQSVVLVRVLDLTTREAPQLQTCFSGLLMVALLKWQFDLDTAQLLTCYVLPLLTLPQQHLLGSDSIPPVPNEQAKLAA